MDPRTGFLPPSSATWDVAARVVNPRPKRRKPRAGSQARFLKPGFLQKPTFASQGEYYSTATVPWRESSEHLNSVLESGRAQAQFTGRRPQRS